MSAVKLYNYFRSSASWRVRIGLALKGIPYEYVPVNLLKGEQRTPEYRAVNPLGAVPVLEIDGLKLAESMAILQYLEETRPTPALLPSSPADRARVRRIAEAFNSGTQPLQNLRVLKRLESQFGADLAATNAWAGHFITEVFDGLEPLVIETAGMCCFGDQVTLADVGLVPQMASVRRFGLDPSRWATLARIEKHLVSLPAFQQADHMRQPDAPKAG